jgi:hypothetical protein
MRTTTTAVEQGVDTGLLRPTLVLRYTGARADPAQRRHRLGSLAARIADADILRAVKALALKSRVVNAKWRRRTKAPLPAIAEVKAGGHARAKRAHGKALIHAPRIGLQRLAVLCLFALPVVAPSPGAAAGLADDIQQLAAKGAKTVVAFCDLRTFEAADCEMLLADLKSGQNTQPIHPTFVAETTSALASLDEFSGCGLSVEESPFHYEDSDGIEAVPAGPFELFRQDATEGQPDMTLLSVSGYSSVSDPGSDPYAWKSFLLLSQEDPCRPTMLAFFRYGGSDRPAMEFHEDGVLAWRHKTLIVTISEAGDGYFRVDAYATHKSADASTSQIAGFDITVMK